jgi:CubicO group peptidase (beta-lactamase class C family)
MSAIPDRLIESSYLARYLLLNTVDISDYRIFPSRDIQNAPPVFTFTPPADRDALVPILNTVVPTDGAVESRETIDEYLARNGTVAFLIVKNDRLLFERYYNGYEHASICTSFSTAKSFVSALIGIAVFERLIGSLDDPITAYLSDLTGRHWPAITVRHLVGMTSGLAYGERGFLPWSDQPRIYYGLDVRALARRARPQEPPGRRFHYNNYNLVLFGMILERVTGGTVSAYLQEKIWKPLGMESPASWSLDSRRSGMEKMESGLNARAVDFAKFGRLYLRRGASNGRQVVPESWVVESTTVAPDARWTNYKYLWWIPRSGKGRFMAVGNLAQFIFVAPDRDCVIVRLGRGRPRDWQRAYVQLFNSIAELI